ncbi:hypothetical protein WJX79_010687 [Trebouxia sp. C0005]
MSCQQEMSLMLRKFQERLMAEGRADDCGEAQKLLRRIEELSREVHRLKAGHKGECKSSSSLRIWNETSQRPQDSRPLAVESYRLCLFYNV